MQEDTMQRMDMPPRRLLVVAMAIALGAAAPAALAQTTTTTSTTSTATTIKRAPVQANPKMIEEAIQRSQARTEKLRTTGKPERFGSEEPFVYSPTR
jgi:hypothetical protein